MANITALLLYVAAAGVAGDADSGRIAPPGARTYFSSNWAYSLYVKPSADWPGMKGDCLAELRKRRGADKGKVLWRRKLVNEWAPRMALISDDGQHVVTVDEWRCGGLGNTLVIYGLQGRLVRHLVASDVLDPDDFKHVKATKGDLQWARGAKFSFSKDGKRLVIRCGWGKLKIIDLDKGRRVRKRAGKLEEMLSDAGISPDELGFGEHQYLSDLEPAELDMPRPDPNNPVDYLAWWNESNRQGVDEQDNAAPLYDQTFAKLAGLHDQSELLSDAIDGGLDAEQVEKLSELLEQNAEALELFTEASERSGYYREYAVGADGSLLSVTMPPLGEMRRAAKAMVARAELASLRGDYDGAVDDCLAGLRSSGHTSQVPSLIEELVAVAVQKLTNASLVRVVARAGDSLDYAALGQRLEQADPGTPDFARAMQLERAMFMDTVQRLYRPDPDSDMLAVDPQIAKSYFHAGDLDLADAEEAKITRAQFDDLIEAGDGYYGRIAESMALPYPQARTAMEQLEGELANEARGHLAALGVLVPGLIRSKTHQDRAESQRRLTHVLLDVLAYRQASGELPDSLDELPGAGEVSIDAFGEEPFVYRRNGDSFTLYSVGPDGQDDGGKHDRRGKEGTDFVVWPVR